MPSRQQTLVSGRVVVVLAQLAGRKAKQLSPANATLLSLADHARHRDPPDRLRDGAAAAGPPDAPDGAGAPDGPPTC